MDTPPRVADPEPFVTISLHTPNSLPLPATDPNREQVWAALLARNGEATCGQLAQDTGLSPASVRNALRKLEQHGRVARVGLKASTAKAPARFRITEWDRDDAA